MDIRRIKNFVVVVNVGSIARAAASLHIAQSALSTQMRQLEDKVGSPLLTRSVKGVVPTAIGMEFYQRAQQLLTMADSLAQIGKDFTQDPEGDVSIGCPTSVGKTLSTPLVEALLRQYPRIHLKLIESPSTELGDLLMGGKIDIAVLFTDNLTTKMHHELVLQEDLYAVGTNLEESEIALSALKGMGLIMPSKPNSARLILEKAFSQRGIIPNVLAEISSPHAMLDMARAGVGITILPWSMLGLTPNPNLGVSRIISPRLTRTIALATSSKSLEMSRTLIVRNLIRDTLRELVRKSQWKGVRLTRTRN